MSYTTITETCVAFKIEEKMILDLANKAIKEQNLILLNKMFGYNKPEEIDFNDFDCYQLMYDLREKNENIKKIDFEDGVVRFYPYNEKGHADLWDGSYYNEDVVYYLPIPYNERLFEPKFKSWEEIIETVRIELPWIPEDYDISSKIILMDSVVYC